MALLRLFLLVVHFVMVPAVAALAYDWQGTPFSTLYGFSHNQKLAAGIVIGFVGYAAGGLFLFLSYHNRRRTCDVQV